MSENHSDPKPGRHTSEFWLTLGTAIVTVLLAVGSVIGITVTEDVTTAIIEGCVAIGTVIASASVVWKYISSRTAVKESTHKAVLAEAVHRATDVMEVTNRLIEQDDAATPAVDPEGGQ